MSSPVKAGAGPPLMAEEARWNDLGLGPMGHKSAGIALMARHRKEDGGDGHLYLLMVLQRKSSADAEKAQWDFTLSMPAGGVARSPLDPKNKEAFGKSPDSAEFKLAMEQHLKEKHAPLLTAVREFCEETLGAFGPFDHVYSTLVRSVRARVKNNAWIKYEEAVRTGQPAEKDPFIAVTFVCVREGLGKELQTFHQKHKDELESGIETRALYWVRLDQIFAGGKPDLEEKSPFFQSVFVRNENYALPDGVQMYPAWTHKGRPSFASYVTRSIALSYKEMIDAAGGLTK